MKLKNFSFCLIILFFILCFFSCSQSEPEINYGFLELVYYENGGRPVERFTFFILPHDNDGIEDLEDLWLYHDWEGLSWHLTRKDWTKETVGNDTWIGSRAIAMEDSSELPRGQFRAVLTDKGGNRTEKLFSFDAPPGRERPFPNLTITGDWYRIDSGFPEQNLLAYDNAGNYLVTVIPSSPEGNLSALGLPSQAESVALWSRDPARSVSAFTDIVPLRD
ncbi:MAG: hypothetical protein FWG07_06550 [Treponema sp.]|nr:hypothetical protein [Treponema sp.]